MKASLSQQTTHQPYKLEFISVKQSIHIRREGTMAKKQIPLRIGEKLYDALASWAEDDFRSLNGQIEYLLTECVKQRKKDGKYVGESIDEQIELDID